MEGGKHVTVVVGCSILVELVVHGGFVQKLVVHGGKGNYPPFFFPSLTNITITLKQNKTTKGGGGNPANTPKTANTTHEINSTYKMGNGSKQIWYHSSLTKRLRRGLP
jgi:hypothetical protein